MKLKSLLFPDLIKILTIKDGILKIEKNKGSIKEFEISEIQKIHVVKSNKNYKLLNFIILLAVFLFLFYRDNFKTTLLLTTIFTSIAVVFILFLKNNTKILFIKFKNKSTYSVKFNASIKALVLKIIWEIKNKNNL
jgi:hypothetical protein